MNLKVYQLGIVEYPQSEQLQHWLAQEIAEGRHPPALILLEHPHVYTFGRQGKKENLLWTDTELKQHGITLHWTDRGGDVTYHGPGQLVGYPIIPVAELGTLGYLRKLEETLIQTLAAFGIHAGRVNGQTGVWVWGDHPDQLPGKIASIGVRVNANRITQHGFALNISPNMAYWNGIVACGLDNQSKTSMAQLLQEPIPSTQVIPHFIDRFSSIFSFPNSIPSTSMPIGFLKEKPDLQQLHK